MKIRPSKVFFSAAAILTLMLSLPVIHAQAKKSTNQEIKFEDCKPLVDFTDFTKTEKGYQDKLGKSLIIPGETTQVGAGPFGGKALVFDGLKSAIATLDASKHAKNFDGFEYTLSFWFRADGIMNPRSDATHADNSIGLYTNLHNMDTAGFSHRAVAPDLHLGASFAINEGLWNHIAVVYCLEKRVKRLYVNGYPIINVNQRGPFSPLHKNKSGKYTIGGFKGAIANIQMWDKAVDPSKFLNMDFTTENASMIRAKINKIMTDCGGANGARIMCTSLTKELDAFIAQKNISMDAYSAFLKRLRVAEWLVPAIIANKKSTMKDAPVALMQIRAISAEKYTPITFPSKPSYDDELMTINARDEYTSISFMAYAYQDIKDLEFEVHDLKGEKTGAILPKDEVEMKFVQAWYQPGWNSYFNGHGSYNPALLLNDPHLLRIDERNKINYLRFDYPSGTQYSNICIPGSVLKEAGFDYVFEPVRDADKLLPCPCDFGRNRQFWMDIHAPKDAKADIYRGKIGVKIGGKEVGYMTLAVKVLPFELPLPMTQYDRKKNFTQYLASSQNIDDLTSRFKDEKKALEWTRKHIINQKKHSIFTQPIGINPEKPENFLKTLAIHKELELPVLLINGGAGFVSYFMEARERQVPFAEVATKERIDKDFIPYSERVRKIGDLLDKHIGRRDIAYFFGIDEAQDAGTLRTMIMYRDVVFREGMNTMTTGWEDNYRNDPSHETYHTTASYVDRINAQKWHYIKGTITTYAAPFIGPDNPHLMRSSHGLKMYRSNYDGWWNLAYDGAQYHTWNHRFGYDTTYRPFRFIVHVNAGPIINTIALCGMREGQDDIRYATLLHQLADECFASNDVSKIVEARKSLAWFRDLQFPVPDDLYEYRAGVTHHIIKLMKLLGKSLD